VPHKRVECTDEWSEPVREFQIVAAAVQKEKELKIRLVQGTCKRLEEEDDLRTREVQRRKM